MEEHAGAEVAIQNGIPVPTFDRQLRRQIELAGPWRVQRTDVSTELSLTAREASLEEIVAEAAGREQPVFDDSAWGELDVPGSLNMPPDGDEIDGWYRRDFFVPDGWEGLGAILKFASVNYVADVWVNGQHLGYHEGGYTPFAFDVTGVLLPGQRNQISVRVDNPQWGSRNDIVPWGLADWWNYGGITGPVWIEATPAVHIVRADVVPHLDGADVSVVLHRTPGASDPLELLSPTPSPPESPTPEGTEGTEDPTEEPTQTPTAEPEAAEPALLVEILPAVVDPESLLTPAAAALVPDDAIPLAVDRLPLPELEEGQVATVDTGFLLGGADHWSPARPALYVLRVTVDHERGAGDQLWTSFGLRHVAVTAETGALRLNGQPTMLTGVGLQDERIEPTDAGERSPAHRIHDPADLLYQLDHARRVNADLIRAGHTPANPLLLMLADRLGFAVWEEIPLYHYTPLTYGIAMERGIPQQMLREMALRDMNRPSVLFHGLSNESTGTDERQVALSALHDVDRQIDGTRLTGQAAYASTPDDPTHAPLDVVGFTFYYGVFYGAGPEAGTERAISVASETHPGKPILALEFGRWADDAEGEARQLSIFEETYPVFERNSAARGGRVGATVWWTLEDFTTMVPSIVVEHFGLFEPSGEARPAALAAQRDFSAAAGGGDVQQIESNLRRAEVVRDLSGPDLRLVGYLSYGLGVSGVLLGAALIVMLRRGGRAAPAIGARRRQR